MAATSACFDRLTLCRWRSTGRMRPANPRYPGRQIQALLMSFGNTSFMARCPCPQQAIVTILPLPPLPHSGMPQTVTVPIPHQHNPLSPKAPSQENSKLTIHTRTSPLLPHTIASHRTRHLPPMSLHPLHDFPLQQIPRIEKAILAPTEDNGVCEPEA